MDEQTESSYDGAGFGKATPPGNAVALLVVDMCVAYFDSSSPLDIDQPSVIHACCRLVDAARAAGTPVMWTRVEFEPSTERSGETGANGNGVNGIWYDKIPALASFDRGSPLGDWLPDLIPTTDEPVFTKQHASGFFGTDLAEVLKTGANGTSIDTVIICGVSTSGCVRATATDASAHGIVGFVVREAVGDRTPAVHEASLFDLHAKYADVIGLDRAVTMLG